MLDNPVWWTDFAKELFTFPASKYKDQCDALSQGLEYVKKVVLEKSTENKPTVLTGLDLLSKNNISIMTSKELVAYMKNNRGLPLNDAY